MEIPRNAKWDFKPSTTPAHLSQTPSPQRPPPTTKSSPTGTPSQPEGINPLPTPNLYTTSLHITVVCLLSTSPTNNASISDIGALSVQLEYPEAVLGPFPLGGAVPSLFFPLSCHQAVLGSFLLCAADAVVHPQFLLPLVVPP